MYAINEPGERLVGYSRPKLIHTDPRGLIDASGVLGIQSTSSGVIEMEDYGPKPSAERLQVSHPPEEARG
jgi:hypothetical protein